MDIFVGMVWYSICDSCDLHRINL